MGEAVMSGIDPKIDILYSCEGCGLRRISVEVPARGHDEAAHWLQQTAMPVLLADHRRRSALCPMKELPDVMIPISGVGRIGEPSKN
jgi:hypothetical protein